MKAGQRIIKCLAIALAIFIIVSIVSAILFSFNIFSGFLGLTKGENIKTEIDSTEMVEKEFSNTQIANIKIDLEYSNLTVKQGDKFKVETNSRYIETKQNSNQLVVKEKSRNIFTSNEQRIVILTIPKDTVLYQAKIEAGAGEIQVEELACRNLDLDMGAGKVTIQNLQVTQHAKIEGGAGKVEIKSGEITNLDLDMGVGNFVLATSLAGNNKIDAGIGKLELHLTNGLEHYTIRATKGIGSIRIGDKNVPDNVAYGNGETNIKIDGGVGSIEIK